MNFNNEDRELVRIICDTFVGAIERADDPGGFWARKASDTGADQVLVKFIEERLPDPFRSGVIGLLGALKENDIVNADQKKREKLIRDLASSSPEAAEGILFLRRQTVSLTYAVTQKGRKQNKPWWVTLGSPEQNPNWTALRYPGPLDIPPKTPKSLSCLQVKKDTVLRADVVIVGSGPGGSVVAATLAERGKKVIVVETGKYYNASDYNQLELWAYDHLYYAGGVKLTNNGTVDILAGATLGGDQL